MEGEGSRALDMTSPIWTMRTMIMVVRIMTTLMRRTMLRMTMIASKVAIAIMKRKL